MNPTTNRLPQNERLRTPRTAQQSLTCCRSSRARHRRRTCGSPLVSTSPSRQMRFFHATAVRASRSFRHHSIAAVSALLVAGAWPSTLLPPVSPLHTIAASARNLPESTGATGNERGTANALVPIVQMRARLQTAATALPNDLSACERALAALPGKETEFKRLFDEYSEGISYKQKCAARAVLSIVFCGECLELFPVLRLHACTFICAAQVPRRECLSNILHAGLRRRRPAFDRGPGQRS